MYEQFFSLSGKPFQLNPDPDFLYASRGHKRAMAYLEYGLHQAEGFIVITGEVGAGKTTLVRNLLRRIPVASIVAAQVVSTQVGAQDLLRLVAGAFGVATASPDKSALLLLLESAFMSLHRQGKRALLIIDEAQNLSTRAVEELRMLSNFQIGNRSLVQSFLVGQPEFRQIMQRPEMRQLNQRVIASYHLGPLVQDETRAYIEHRLTHVGWRSNPTIESEAYEAIFNYTGGVPRRINTLCDRLLLSAFLSGRNVISGADVGEVTREIDEEMGSPISPGVPVNGHRDAPLKELLSVPDIAVKARADQDLRHIETRLTELELRTARNNQILRQIASALRLSGSESA